MGCDGFLQARKRVVVLLARDGNLDHGLFLVETDKRQRLEMLGVAEHARHVLGPLAHHRVDS